MDFHGQQRRNATHQSTTDPEAQLLRKGKGKEAKLCFGLHALMENRHGLCVQAQVTTSAGVTETSAATELLARQVDEAERPPETVGADKGYHNAELVSFCRDHGIAPHVAQIKDRKVKGLDGRTTRTLGCQTSQKLRKRIEEIFGWCKEIGGLRRTRNCQVAVSLHWSTAQMSCPLLWRLYLPRHWLDDPTRRRAGRIPAAIQYQSKNELALELVDQALEWELPRLPVVADSAYGNDFSFREALRQRGVRYVVAVEPSTKVWTTDPNLIPVLASQPRGRPRQYAPLAALPTPQTLVELAGALAASAWRTVTWRAGSQGPQRSRFAQVKVWAAHGWKVQQHPVRVAEWLLIEWPEGAAAPSHYWLADLGRQPVGLRRLVRTARARWRVELDYRELKEELGLDHYEGRHWLGWHHHVTLVSVAFAFLRTEQSRLQKNFWCDAAADTPVVAGGADPLVGPLPMGSDALH